MKIGGAGLVFGMVFGVGGVEIGVEKVRIGERKRRGVGGCLMRREL